MQKRTGAALIVAVSAVVSTCFANNPFAPPEGGSEEERRALVQMELDRKKEEEERRRMAAAEKKLMEGLEHVGVINGKMIYKSTKENCYVYFQGEESLKTLDDNVCGRKLVRKLRANPGKAAAGAKTAGHSK